jgi:probable rRNA maturation factor
MTTAPVRPRIIVRNSQRKVPVDVRALRRFAERALQQAKLPQRSRSAFADLAEISATIVSDARMAAIHQRFLSIAGPTDVITFQHGEIIVSAETARRNAGEYRTSPENEIRLYIIHGILHLMGFDDTTPAAARTMAKTQQAILAAATSPPSPA